MRLKFSKRVAKDTKRIATHVSKINLQCHDKNEIQQKDTQQFNTT